MAIKKTTIITPLHITEHKIPKVAAYARISVDFEPNLCSLDYQISYYSNFIKNNPNWKFAGIFSDEGITGTKSNRPGFTSLINACEKGLIDIIYTKSISRFARNTVDLLSTIRKLKELNINVHFEKENIDSVSNDGELMLTLLASFAQEESRSISENTKWAIRKNFDKGIGNSFVIYGYDWNGKDFNINHNEAAVVKYIFDSYLLGLTPHQIATNLNEKSIKPLRGHSFNYTTIWGMLRQIKYTGISILQKTFRENHLSHKTIQNSGQLPQYYVEGTHPIIIDEDTFKKVQEEINKRKALGYLANQSLSFSCFTSKVFCSVCGKTYRRRIIPQKTKNGTKINYYKWICGLKIKKTAKSCQSCNVPEKILYDLTADVLHTENFNKTMFDATILKITVGEYKLNYHLQNNTIITKEWKTERNNKIYIEQRRRKNA